MIYRIGDIAQITGGQLSADSDSAYPVEYLVFDSRRIHFPDRSLFFALRGVRQNGHLYIKDAFEKGVRCFVLSKDADLPSGLAANIIRVDDPLEALQQLATHHRRQFKLPVIGITGSNGKTIVKEWLFQLLNEELHIVRSPESYNSQIGVPLSVWQIHAQHQLGIFEAGISQVGEMEKLQPIVDCRIGVLTHMSGAHDEGFVSQAEKIREKWRLFQNAEVIIYGSDDPQVQAALSDVVSPALFRWSAKDDTADLFIRQVIREDGSLTRIEGSYRQQDVQIRIPFHDQASIENAILCWSVLLYLKVNPLAIARRMNELEAVAMRLEMRSGINNCLLVNDSYNSDLHSLQTALHFLRHQGGDKSKTLILSDILQSGLSATILYSRVAALLAEENIERVIGIGREVPALEPLLPAGTSWQSYPDTDHFLDVIAGQEFHQEAILLKGARRFAFERIADRLALRAHKAMLEIRLDALIHNLQVYSSRLRSDTRIMVMVKASAYGSGSLALARLLEFQQVSYLAVAYTDEGIELRKQGIRLPILVLNPDESGFPQLIQHQLEPEIYSLDLLERFCRYLSSEAEVPVHLKLDTGMHRLGLEAPQLEDAVRMIKAHPALRVRSVFSHLAGSEAAQHDDFSRQQFEKFEKKADRLEELLGYRPLRHMLNSSGIARWADHQYDMVRLGLGLYGIDSSGELQGSLQAAHQLKAHISQVKTVAKGESIGYDRQGRADSEIRIATVNIGYADGFLRRAGNGRYHLRVRGQLAPTIGNICMDMCMIDVSHLPEVSSGDEVIIFGEDLPISQLAEVLETIPYEVLTNISERVRRVYLTG